MKKLVYLSIAFAMLLVACQSKKDKGFSISGQFQQANGHRVFLNQVQGNNLIAVDSATLDGQGKFRFAGKNTDTRFYIVSVVSKDRKVTNNLQLLVGPQEQVQLSGSLNSDLKQNYIVNGSKDSKLIQELNQQLAATSKSMDSVARVYRQAMAENGADSSLKSKLDQRYNRIKNSYRRYSEKLIADNDSSLVGIMALFQYYGSDEKVFAIDKDLKYFESVLQQLKPLYPNSELVKSLNLKITAQRRQLAKKAVDVKAVQVGAIAPEIVLNTPSGKRFALSSLRGKYVLVDFWASWCRPCREENPVLVKTYKKYKAKGLRIVQVSLDKDKSAWTKAIKADKLNWVHVSDLQHWRSQAAAVYNVRSIPANFLLDPEGRIIAKNLRGDALGTKLSEVF